MCGIAGYIGYSPPTREKIIRTLHRMRNRGPDFQSHVLHRAGDLHTVLLHSRLSIIDLDPRSHQPFRIGDCTLVFNGEIYNYIELREDLEKQGIAFTTTSDTEVLLHSFLRYGPDCVKHFEGMWSFAVYDAANGTLILSRDRFGEKPLYLFRTTDGLYFGSEVKFLSALSGEQFSVNDEQLLRYLINGYKSLYKTGDTFFRSITEVPPGCNMEFRRDFSTPRSWHYWKPTVNIRRMSREEAVDGVRSCLVESMKLRLRADVPLAFCLSGGVDSSLLASIAAKSFNYDVACFSIIDPDERYNELGNIRATIADLGCRSTCITLEPETSTTRLEELIAYHDAPIATITYYIHSMLSERIAADGFRVVFSGTAADELFTGYYDHFLLHLSEMRDHPSYADRLAEWKRWILPFVRNPFLQNPNLYDEDPDFRGHIYLNSEEFERYLTVPFHEPFTEARFCGSLLRNRMLNEVLHEATRVILHEDDLNSMNYSLENRSPYLDAKLFEFAYSIPPELLIRDGYGKFLLRAAAEGILNDTVRLDRQKKGFNASIFSVFHLKHRALRELLLDQSPIYDFVNRQSVENVLAMEELPNSFSKFLFNFINAKIFLEQHR